MSNRKNATRAQRVWRFRRKQTVAEMQMTGGIHNRAGELLFIWRPDEYVAEITDIKTRGCRAPKVTVRIRPANP